MSGLLLGILAFGTVAGSFAVWYRRIQRVDIPADRRAFVALWLAGAGLGVIALGQGGGWLAGTLAVLAILAGALVCLLVLVSPQKVADDAIRVGESLRDFTATDEHGADFAIGSLAGKPVLLKFFRGHW